MPEKGWTFMYQVNAHTLIIWTVVALSADTMTFAAQQLLLLLCLQL